MEYIDWSQQLGRVNDGEKSSINQIWVAWEVRVQGKCK